MRLAAAFVVLAILAGIAVLAIDVSHQIDNQSSANSDNTQWTLSQVDVELMALEIDLDDTGHSAAHLPELRRRFDIFYARVNILQVGSTFARLRENPDFDQSFSRLEAFVAETAKLMDGPDADLLAAVPVLQAKVRALMPDGRQIGLMGVSLFAAQSDERRAEVKATLEQLAFATLALIAALVAMLVRVLQLDRVNRRKAEETAQTLDRLDAVVNTSLDAVITLNDEGRIVDFNPAACQTFGYSREEAVGRDLSLLVPHLSPSGTVQLPAPDTAHATGHRRFRVWARHGGGTSFPAEVSLARTQAGARPLHVIFLRDLSQQVAAEQALVSARDKALAGAKTKADLLLVMSHEIRTPLNGMMGTIELLEGTELSPQQRDYLRIMAASGRLLMHHINDVLEVARLDSGRATLALAPVDLEALASEVIANQHPAAMAGGNRLRFQPEPSGRHRVQGDGSMIRHVLMNLVGNALKFTRDGEVVVAIRHLTPQGPTEISVSDTGIGIAPEDIGRIFEDFVTLDASYARNASGTGLGLGIVRRIVTRMGGTICVDSEVGNGSTFRVSLPLTILDTADPAMDFVAAADKPEPGTLNVLVVEDNEFNRLIVRDMLRLDGHRVTEAQNGLEGVQLAEARAFDAILMDISMPGIDGLQAAGRIRGGNGASKDAPIIALTAHATREEAARFRAGGMDEVLVKPITRDGLRAVLAGQRPHVAAAAPSEGLIDADVMAQLRESLGVERSDRLVDQFLADTEGRIGGLAVQVMDETAELVADIHRMVGSAAMFGASAFHTRLSLVEDMCKRGDKTQARQALPGLAQLWQATAAAYRARAYRTGAKRTASRPDGAQPDGDWTGGDQRGGASRPQASSLR